MHMQRHIGVTRNETLDDRGQCITGLSVSSGNREAALLFFSELFSYLTDTLDLKQHLLCGSEYRLAGWCDMSKVLATASENFHAQLVFQQPNLFTDARL